MVAFGLTVVRHGETRFNKEKILQGQGVDEPLSETGFRQANAAGIYLSNIKFTHVFTSDLLRAKQTTTIILKKSQFCKEVAIRYDARLRERKYGIAEGRPLGDLKAMATAAGEQCPSFTPPGGETLEEVKARGKDFFEYLCSLVAREADEETQTTPRTKRVGAEMGEEGFPTSLTNTCSELGCLSDPDGAAEVLAANVLVVSHGAYMRNWISYFISDCECTLPATLKKTELSCVSPNTGISQFLVQLETRENIKPKVHCIYLNKSDHLGDMKAETIKL